MVCKALTEVLCVWQMEPFIEIDILKVLRVNCGVVCKGLTDVFCVCDRWSHSLRLTSSRCKGLTVTWMVLCVADGAIH